MSETAKENYWKIVSWYDMPYGRVAKGMWIGHADNPKDKIYWENPYPPADKTQILNHEKAQEDQYWSRHESPHFWSKQYMDRLAIEKYSSGSTEKQRQESADYYWYFNTDRLTDEQFEYQDREWVRRLHGVWIYINGEVTYLTGKYYTYLQHWWLVDCYPEFRDRDLLSFYAWQSSCNDSMCYGMIFPKHRRAGDTTKWAYEAVEETTRTKGGHFGIQAAGEKGASKVFNDKVKPGWKRWPLFFKPITSSGDNPKMEIIMDAESRRGRSQHNDSSVTETLEGWIKYAPNGGVGEEPFDGDKLTRFFRDEGGKEKKTDIIDTWGLVKPTLTNRLGRGKSAWPSTVEDVGGKYEGAFERMYFDSLPSLAETTGTRETISGLKALFIPCYCGHEEFWFIGKFGESIVHKPTPGQREWLLANRATDVQHREELAIIYDQGGAYEYELRRRAANNGDIKHKRKFPFTIEEVFAATNPECYYNLDHLNDMNDQLTRPELDENDKPTNLFRKLTSTGRLEWTNGLLSDVVFVEDSRGAFVMNAPYLPGGEMANKLGITANNVVRRTIGGRTEVHNGSGCIIKIGFDPQKQDSDESTGHKSGLSKAAGHGFYPYNDAKEDSPWDESIPGFSQNFVSHAFLFEYYMLPKDSTTTHEDMLKACIFFNAKFHCEKQVFTAIQYFKRVGANGLLLRDVILNGMNRQSGMVVAGQAANEMTEQQANDRIRDFIEYHPYANRCPFPRTIAQLIKYNKKNVSQLDLKVSFGFTLMASQPEVVPSHKLAQKAVHTVKEKPNFGKWADSMVGLTSGYGL